MTELHNKAGQFAVVVPFEDAAPDIQVHGGKIVTPIHHGTCGLGSNAWTTDPVLYDGYENALCWDDRDLKPLGAQLPQHSKTTTFEAEYVAAFRLTDAEVARISMKPE